MRLGERIDGSGAHPDVRIFVITSSYPRHPHDHAGSFVEAQVRHLVELGHDVEVFCWDDKLRATLESSWPVHRVRYAPGDAQYLFYGGGAPENLGRYPALGIFVVPAVVAMASRLLASSKPDLVMGHWFVPGGVLARLAGTFWGIPSVVVGHSGGLQLMSRLPRPVARLAIGAVLDGPTTLPSRPLVELARSFAPHAEPRVMPMGVDLPDGLGPPQTVEPGRALFLGRLEPIKGPRVALEAARQVDWDLDVAGEGSMRRELEAEYDANFLGFVGGEEKWRAIDRASISLHTSVPQGGRHEGLPVALLECALRQTFPLVSGSPGVEEWLVDEAVQLHEPGDAVRFAEALEWWANLPARKRKGLAEAQRARVEPLRWERWIHEWDALLGRS